jgi:hypothetical protein
LEEAECVCPAVHHLVEPPSTSQLTNQQFINCAFLERPPLSSVLTLVLPYSARIVSIGVSLKMTSRGRVLYEFVCPSGANLKDGTLEIMSNPLSSCLVNHKPLEDHELFSLRVLQKRHTFSKVQAFFLSSIIIVFID